MSELFGRTNHPYSRLWLSLQMGLGEAEGWAPQLADAAAESGAVIDISNNPGFWGELLRNRDVPLLTFGGKESEAANGADHATDLVSAHIFQTLSSLGRMTIDFYFLQVRRAWEEYQVDGAFQALENARQDGLIKHFGIWAEGHPMAVLGWWQFRDAFEAAMIPNHPLAPEYAEMFVPLAEQRRVGLVGCQSLSWGTGCAISELPGIKAKATASDFLRHAAAGMTTMVGVRSAREVEQAMEAVANPLENNALIAESNQMVEDPEQWRLLLEDRRPWVRRAAERRLHAR